MEQGSGPMKVDVVVIAATSAGTDELFVATTKVSPTAGDELDIARDGPSGAS